MAKREVHLSGPDVNATDVRAVATVLKSRSLSLGPKVPEFEAGLAKRAGRKYAVAVNSGTSALHLILLACGVGPGDDVVTTPFSFVASANCAMMVGAKPVFVDIELPHYNVSLEAVERYVRGAEKKPKAVLVVDVFGQPSDWSGLEKLCKREGIALIEDSCEALGSRVRGRNAGSFGDAAAFAFYPNKQMTTGEGGCVVTDSEDIARMCRSLRNQGRGDSGAWLAHERLGYNFRIADINCALGVSQLARLDQFIAKRDKVAERYQKLLKRVEGVYAPEVGADIDVMSWFVYVVRLADRFGRKQRDEVMAGLRKMGIGCNNYFAPIHLMPFYREQFGFVPGDFPVTESAGDRTIALPFHNKLTAGEQRYVVETLEGLIERA